MPVQIQFRRDTAANWTSNNPTLASGELGVETDTGQFKVGNGSTVWNSLAYGGVAGDTGIEISDTEPISTDILWLDTDEPGDAVLPLGGSTGQVLQKIDGDDYNTEWASLTASDVTDITASASALNTIDDGTAGYTALSNGTAGISYQPVSHNYVINGAFDIWQRGTDPFTATNDDFTADRWRFRRGVADPTTATISQESFTPADVNAIGFGEGEYFLRYSLTTIGSSINNRIEQRVEDVRTLAGQDVTVSFWAKSSASFTSTLSLLQFFGSGGSSFAEVTDTVSVGTSWERHSVTLSLPSISGKTVGTGSNLRLSIQVNITDGETTDIWGIQLEAGSVATPFKRNANSIQGEFAACQRYFQRLGGDQLNDRPFASGVMKTTTNADHIVRLPVRMRSAPTGTSSAAGTFYVRNVGGDTVPSVVAVGQSSPETVTLAVTRSAVTTSTYSFLQALGTANAFFDLNAEL